MFFSYPFRLPDGRDYEQVLRDISNMNSAFQLTEKDLSNVGWLMYGDLNDYDKLVQVVEDMNKRSICAQTKSNLECLSEPPKNMPVFHDGEIEDRSGKKILHRYQSGCRPDGCLFHNELSIGDDGLLKVNEEQLYYFRTGVMY